MMYNAPTKPKPNETERPPLAERLKPNSKG